MGRKKLEHRFKSGRKTLKNVFVARCPKNAQASIVEILIFLYLVDVDLPAICRNENFNWKQHLLVIIVLALEWSCTYVDVTQFDFGFKLYYSGNVIHTVDILHTCITILQFFAVLGARKARDNHLILRTIYLQWK